MNQIEENGIGQALKLLTDKFNYSLTPNLDAQVLLAHITQKNRAWILSHEEYTLSADQKEELSSVFSQINDNVPLPYILGHWEFYNLEFDINPNVLIPRPETEILVETAIKWLQAHPKARNSLDIGTGSGCIAISLAVNIPDLSQIGVDLSEKALIVAEKNAFKHKVTDRISFHKGNLFEKLSSSFDLITANLPYIPTSTLRNLEIHGQEPTLALNGGASGLSVINRLIKEAPHYIKPGGLMLVEIGASQGEFVLEYVHDTFNNCEISLLSDFSGNDRLLSIQT